MASSKGPSSVRNTIHNGRNSLLPPKSPFPSIPPSYADYIPNPSIGPKSHSKPREGNSLHHRTSSESFLVEEQPSWLDELLDEPDTPGRRGGHRRSSSDSFAYIDAANIGSMNYIPQDDNKFKNITPVPSWGSQNLNNYRDIQHSSFYADLNPADKTKNKPWDQKEDPKFEKKDSSNVRTSAPETDTKRAKQQFAQRSRVRKLQYIAELERTVQALQMQAEGSEVSAELEFLNQQNLILSMENKALKHRLESLSQEQLIKYLEQEVLEREAGRLRNLYQQQQQQNLQQLQQQPKSSGHRRTRSRSDLDRQFANLSLKNKQANASHDSLSSQLHI